MAATYSKLRSGEWGIRVDGAASEGQQVTVRKRDGSTKVETVKKVVWSGNGVSLCAIGQTGNGGSNARSERNRYPRTGCSCGSRDGYPQDTDCFTCRHDA